MTPLGFDVPVARNDLKEHDLGQAEIRRQHCSAPLAAISREVHPCSMDVCDQLTAPELLSMQHGTMILADFRSLGTRLHRRAPGFTRQAA